MPNLSGLEQLQALQKQLNELIDSFPASSVLHSLDTVGEPNTSEPQDPHLERLSAKLNQMQALVQGDRLVFQRAFEYHIPSCLRVAIEAHVEETLREAGKPLKAEELAKSSGIDPSKLAFSSEQGGLPAIIAHFAEEGMRANSYSADSLLSPKAEGEFAFSRAYDGDKLWTYFGNEGNEAKQKRFGCAMGKVGKILDRNESVLTNGFPWKDLPENSTVCDVGGGKGDISLEIHKAIPRLKFVVQDQEKTIENGAIPFWKANASEALEHRVKLMPHDILTPQPVEGAAVYLMRLVLHGFIDEQVVQILSHLAQAASPSSKLVIVEASYESLASLDSFPPKSNYTYLLDMQRMSSSFLRRLDVAQLD
ncbi:hypothetical protein JCM5353_001397 [Sporobolomyces roseus]